MPGLFVTQWLPRPDSSSGYFRRQQLLAEALKLAVGEVDVLSYCSDRDVQEVQAEVARRWGRGFRVTICPPAASARADSLTARYLHPAFEFTRMRGFQVASGAAQQAAFEATLEGTHSVILAHRLPVMVPLLRTRRALPRVVFDMDDIEHLALARQLAAPPFWWSKWLEFAHLPALLAGERRALKAAAVTLTCSERDRARLRRLASRAAITAIPNAMPVPTSVAAIPPDAHLVMLGHYAYAPNRAGAEYFLARVWPRILAVAPAATLEIAGPESQAISHFSAPPSGVRFSGYVEDLDTLYARARAVVCPILSGSGTRVKIMEAAGHGRAIVSTRLGAEGIDLSDGREILLADRPEDFAAACLRLLNDPVEAGRIGQAARAAIRARYDRESVIGTLVALLRGAPATPGDLPRAARALPH